MALRIEDYTVEDFKRLDGSFLVLPAYRPLPDASEADNKSKIMETLSYLEDMGSTLQVPVLGMRLLGNFTGTDGRLITDQTTLNQKLISFKESIESPQWKKDSMQLFAPIIGKNVSENVSSDIISKRRKIEQDLQTYQRKLGEIIEQQQELNLNFGRSVDFCADNITETVKTTIAALADNNFYEFIGFSERYTYLLTQPIELRLYEPHRGLDITRQMGRFTVCIPHGKGQPKVRAGLHNYDTDYIHPHVSASSTICWGNVANHWQNLLLSGDYSGLLQLIQDLLTNYNPESPYQALQDNGYLPSAKRFDNASVVRALAVSPADVAAFEDGVDMTQVIEYNLADHDDVREEILDDMERHDYMYRERLILSEELKYLTDYSVGSATINCAIYDYNNDSTMSRYTEDYEYDEDEGCYEYALKVVKFKENGDTNGTCFVPWEALTLKRKVYQDHPLFLRSEL